MVVLSGKTIKRDVDVFILQFRLMDPILGALAF